MDLPSSTERVLAQPTRASIFQLLVDHRGPLPTGEIARRLGLHVNGVRRHLERLTEEGLIERRRERGGRGRPGDLWVVASDASPDGERPTAYTELAVWLAEAMPDDEETVRRIEEIGRRVGRKLQSDNVEEGGRPLSEIFRDTFAALGFQPHIEADDDGGFSCSLGNCPYLESAAANPKAICGLHRGMTEGLLECAESGAKLVTFQPQDPHEAGCLVTVR